MPVWSSPTYDSNSGLLFFGAGENYSDPATITSDAIFAVDADSGKRRWVRQFTEGDTFNMGCLINGLNCPDAPGPDLGFGVLPVIANNGKDRQVLYVGQKSGHVHAMDPSSGEVLWSKHLSRGGYLGGIHWGLAADEKAGILYVTISDYPSGGHSDLPAVPGMFALNLHDGSVLWKNLKDTSAQMDFGRVSLLVSPVTCYSMAGFCGKKVRRRVSIGSRLKLLAAKIARRLPSGNRFLSEPFSALSRFWF